MAAMNHLIIITTFLLILVIFFFFNTSNSIKLPSTIPIFGDSTVDTSNNNYIKTLAKGNYLPYGQDFPDRPPFLDPDLSDDELLSGVSFASDGSGLDDLATVASKAIPISKQIKLFRDYIRRIKGIVVWFYFSAATNDFIINFYDIPIRRLEFTVSGYQDFLLDKLQSFVKDLYELGCRTVIIVGLPPIGCLPIQMTLKFENPLNRKCLKDQNSDAQSYNHKLSKLLNQLQPLLPCSKIVFANGYQPLIDMVDHPHKYRIVETKRGCCGSGLIEIVYLCNPTTPTYGKPSQFLFWDSIHPTQSAYKFLTDYMEIEILPKLSFDQSR
ncbi:hypothetical protein ACOSQ2_033258 [Xanthoceras sorbifolium]